MPKISDEKRAIRRVQILEAAWNCFQRQGLHATTMHDIIRASGLSAGAVYSYFPSKEVLIVAAVTTSLTGLRELVGPLLQASAAAPPALLIRRIAEAIDNFTMREGYDLKRIALLGWSEAQRNEGLRETMKGFYFAFRHGLADAADGWRRDGLLPEGAASDDVAKAVMATILGFVVQSAILGDAPPLDIARGIDALASKGSGDAP